MKHLGLMTSGRSGVDIFSSSLRFTTKLEGLAGSGFCEEVSEHVV